MTQTNILSPSEQESSTQDFARNKEINHDNSRYLEQMLKTQLQSVFEKIVQDEIAQTLKPNEYTPENDILEMRKFYLDRVSEIV